MEKGTAQLQITGLLKHLSPAATENSHFSLVVAGKDLKSKFDAYAVVSVLDSAGKAIGKPRTTSKFALVALFIVIND